MKKMEESTKLSNEGYAFGQMRSAFGALKNSTPSRENSLAMTNLEQAMMWCNKDRTNKGEFTPHETHVV